MTLAPDWIAADWGTSHLRLWAISDGEILETRRSDAGMGGLAPDQFAPALARATEGWAPAPVVACGMVGARQGWVEAPYLAAPCAATPLAIRAQGDPPVWILRGVSQAAPPDVMRGEETQIAGLLAVEPDFDGVACLPGTHCKWARISAGEICHFQSFLTGELFDLLSRRSVLRHGLAEGVDDAAFDAGVEAALAQPHTAYGALFRLRAAGLLGDADPVAAKARLSGLLIGWELAAAKPYWLGQRVAVIGDGALARLYIRALAAQGVAAEAVDGGAAVLAGLAAAWTQIRAQT